MDFKKAKRLLVIVAVVYWLFSAGIYSIARNEFRFGAEESEAPAPEWVVGELVDGRIFSQQVSLSADLLNGVELMIGTYDRDNSGTLFVEVLNAEEELLGKTMAPLSDLEDNAYCGFSFEQQIQIEPNEPLAVRLYTQDCSAGNAVTIYAGSASSQFAAYQAGQEESLGSLCVRLRGVSHLVHYRTYWIVVAAAFAAMAVYGVISWRRAKRGKGNLLVSLLTVYTKYTFLIKQLVARDFKTKYKRSTLGMVWSVLNPLLTMSIQYVVFSTLFKTDIPNYPVYLLTGIVFFGFFSEALSLGMTSITSNAPLIKKVYMPKYIYPLSRTFSSLVNFAMALIPLMLMVIVTGTAIRASILLLVFDILCYLSFIIGMTLLLTTAMTFFQDTQFLWTVVSMMWQYLTPIFYPETIIPANLLPIYKLNPLYQYITFARICIIEGVSPAPGMYLQCVVSAIVILALGICVFKKHQNKFVLYV